MKLEFTVDELYARLRQSGYSISFAERNGSIFATFTGRYSQSYELPTCYSLDYDPERRFNECVPELLHWAGYRIIMDIEPK
jgi:hypothetical protein